MSDASQSQETDTPGVGGTLIAALAAAVTLGVLFGLGDAVVADIRMWPPEGFAGYLGCYAAAVMSYTGLACVLLLPLSLVFHGLLAKRSGAARLCFLLGLGLFFGLFSEIYWWTRPYVFYGHSSVSPERLAAAAVQALVAGVLAILLARSLMKLPRGVHLSVRFFGLIAIIGGGLFVRSEQALIESRGTLNERNRELPNVLLVIVDALRADYLACYGNTRVATPVMDSLADRGVLVENCFVQAPYTLTSFGSIFTGKYPRRHGLVAQKAGVQMKPNVTLPVHLKSAKLRDTDESLRDSDYACGTFMTGAVSHGSGLARGFDAYSEAMMGHDLVQVDSQWSRFRSELLLWVFKSKLSQRVDSSLVVTTARRWLRDNKDRRWMAMVHLYSTHTPYDPPKEFKEPYLDASYDGPFTSFYADHRYALERGEYEPTESDVQRIGNLYEAGAAQADAMIGELLAELDELGVMEDTLIIVTSDHGEDLGEWRSVDIDGEQLSARFWEHNHMWQTNLAVPLIMANTRLLPHGVRVSDMVESVDILPTICDLLKLELPQEETDQGLVTEIDGQSFLPAILGSQRGESVEYQPKRYSYSENNVFLSIQDDEAKLIVPTRLVAKGDFEALFSNAQWVRFFDLSDDPDEGNSLTDSSNAKLRELWLALVAYDESMPEPVYIKTERDMEYVKMLNALGYVDGIDPGAEDQVDSSVAPDDGEEKKD
ncbi:MAG: arylsulfatase A-like enzyme [Planctomycetota bacterium]